MVTSRHLSVVASAVLLIAAISPQASADKDIHIKSGRTVSGSWNLADGAGYQWNIYVAGGYVNSGSHSAYSSGMQLQVGGSGFSGSSSGRLSKDGREIEIGPWQRGSVKIYRRIYVDPKIGYCRWIDIFENTATSPQVLTLRYYNGMGTSTRRTYTNSGGTNVTDKDWGIVTGYTSNSYSAVAHIFATKTSKVRPRFQWRRSNSTVYYHHTLKIPAKKTVALCLIEAQRRPFSEAQKFLTSFKVEKELKKVPPALRRIIVNMSGAMLTLGSLELPRNEEHDLIVRRGGNELLGTLLNENYVVETLYGKLTLPAVRVMGLSAPRGAGDRIRLGLVDGQVIVGKLASGPIRLKLADGNEMTMSTDKIDTAAYRVSPKRPEEVAFRKAMVVMRGGQQLFFKPDDVDWSFHTQYGRVKLKPGDLRTVMLDTPDGGLHRAIFKNDSVISGLLVTEKLSVTLDLGPKLAVPRYLISHFAFPGGEYDGPKLAVLTLRNEDTLYGRITDDSLKIDTDVEQVSVGRREIAQITIPEEASVGRIRAKLHNGTVVEGKLAGRTVGFQIDPGPKLAVYVGHVVEAVCPKPPTGSTTQPVKSAAKTVEKTANTAAVSVPRGTTPEKRIAIMRDQFKKLKAELAAATDRGKSNEIKKRMAVLMKRIAQEAQRAAAETDRRKTEEAAKAAAEAAKAAAAAEAAARAKQEAIQRERLKRLRDRN